MRRYAFIALIAVSASCRVQHQVEVGENSVRLVNPATTEGALAQAAAELTQLGFTVGGREENLVFTTPQPLPAAAAAGGPQQLWFLHVVADDRLFRGGADVTVRGFLVPHVGNMTPGNVVQQRAIPITAARPEAFREVRRIAERLNAVANP